MGAAVGAAANDNARLWINPKQISEKYKIKERQTESDTGEDPPCQVAQQRTQQGDHAVPINSTIGYNATRTISTVA